MKLNEFGEVEKQKDFLESATLLLGRLRTGKSPAISLDIGNQGSLYIVDEALQTLLMKCLTQYAEVVKERLTNLGVELRATRKERG